MIKILGRIPPKVVLACSGGVDSMSILDFLMKGKRDVTVAYFHHGTIHGQLAFEFLETRCTLLEVPLVHAEINISKPKGSSIEEFWRNERYKFLRSFGLDRFVITCHHLDDSLETWLFGACHGRPKLIPYENKGIYRPFLLNKKESLVKWANKNIVFYIEDPSNEDLKYKRNYIRHHLVPAALKVNPGLHKNIAKLIKNNYEKPFTKDSKTSIFTRKARTVANRVARVWQEHIRTKD
jgi:tRNA(Ile)-lysidine synthase